MPADASTPGAFRQVEAGGWHTCAVRANGVTVCWGGDWYGQATVPVLSQQLDGGTDFTCGVGFVDHKIRCWGDNAAGQAPAVKDGNYNQVSAGGAQACAHKVDGTLDCWGSNVNTPSGNATAVSTGAGYSCRLLPDGRVDCWGINDHGQSDDRTGPFAQVSAGTNHTCAVRQADGYVECWGDSGYGKLKAPADVAFTQSCRGRESHLRAEERRRRRLLGRQHVGAGAGASSRARTGRSPRATCSRAG